MIYDPHDDSFLLQQQVQVFARHKHVLDMGTGSGLQAKAALKAEAKSVLAVDIDEDAVAYCKKKGIDAIKSDLFEKISDDSQFDLIVFNPPYLPKSKGEDADSERITTGGYHGDELTLKFLEQALLHLTDGGVILIIVSDLARLDRLEAFIKANKLVKTVVSRKKLFMEELQCWKIM